MSARGRKSAKTGAPAEKPPSEFFPTPAWCVTRLLDYVPLPGGVWLEPSAGDGAIIRAANSVRADVTWEACEIRGEGAVRIDRMARSERVRSIWLGDFLHPDAYGPESCDGFAVCLGNPPFSLAARFVDRALDLSDTVVMLLRLNFLGSSTDRRDLFERRGMPDVWVLPNRPSFTGEGTDATEYGWMLWKRDKSQEGRVRILWDKAQRSLFEATP